MEGHRTDEDEERRKEEAQKQVDAFMEMIEKRFDLDEQKVRHLAERSASNGKLYITYAFVVGVLLTIVGVLGLRDMTRDDARFEALEQEIHGIREKQIDVRERLRVLEQEHARIGTQQR